jgi:hypothetical protein
VDLAHGEDFQPLLHITTPSICLFDRILERNLYEITLVLGSIFNPFTCGQREKEPCAMYVVSWPRSRESECVIMYDYYSHEQLRLILLFDLKLRVNSSHRWPHVNPVLSPFLSPLSTMLVFRYQKHKKQRGPPVSCLVSEAVRWQHSFIHLFLVKLLLQSARMLDTVLL